MTDFYEAFYYQEIPGASPSPYNLSSVTTNLNTLATTGDATKFLEDNVKGVFNRLVGMNPSIKLSNVIITIAFITCTVNGTSRSYLLRRTYAKHPFKGIQVSLRNYVYIPVTGHSSLHAASTYSDTAEFGLIKSLTATNFEALFNKAPSNSDGYFEFKSIRTELGGVAESALSNSKAYTFHYNPAGTGSEIIYTSPTNSNVKIVIGNPSSLSLDMTIPMPEVLTEKLPDVIKYIYPFEEVEEDEDTEEEVFIRISQGDKLGDIARANPNKFLKSAQNYILYHGYLKTGHYN